MNLWVLLCIIRLGGSFNALRFLVYNLDLRNVQDVCRHSLLFFSISLLLFLKLYK